MAASLKVRLAQSHGMNSRWCHQALERIKKLEKGLNKILDHELTGDYSSAEPAYYDLKELAQEALRDGT